jgi:hypothetical protein
MRRSSDRRFPLSTQDISIHNEFACGAKRTGVPTEVAEKLKAMERENRELKQANEILCSARLRLILHWPLSANASVKSGDRVPSGGAGHRKKGAREARSP